VQGLLVSYKDRLRGYHRLSSNTNTALQDTRPIRTISKNDHSASDTKPVPVRANTIHPMYGEFLGEFRFSHQNRVGRFFIMLIGLAIVLIPLAYSVWNFEQNFNLFGYIPAGHRSLPFLAISCLGLILFCCVVFWRWLISLKKISLYKTGIRITKPFSPTRWVQTNQVKSITTSFIEKTFLGGKLFQVNTLAIGLENEHLKFHSSSNEFPRFIDRIKELVYPCLIPALVADFEDKRWISFGPLSIQKQGLQIRNEKVQWKTIRTVQVQSGFLLIELIGSIENSKSGNYKLPLAAIPNIEILLQLIDTGWRENRNV
jgi:hypothetical protein